MEGKCFSLKTQKYILYQIKLNIIDNKIKLEAESDSEEVLPKKIFAKKYSQEEFSNINPIFLFDNIQSIYDKLIKLFNNNKMKLYEETNYLNLEILLNQKNTSNFYLQMEEIKFDIDTSLNHIYSLIKDLKREIKTQNKDIETLLNETIKILINYIVREINYLKKLIEKKNDKIEQLQNDIIKLKNSLNNEIKKKNNKIEQLQNDINELKKSLNNEIKEKNNKIREIEGYFEEYEDHISLSQLKKYIKEIYENMNNLMQYIYTRNNLMNLEKKFPEKEFQKIIEFDKIYDTILESKIYCAMGTLTKNKYYFDKGIENYYDNFTKCYNKHPLSYTSKYKSAFKIFGELLYEESIGKNGNKDEILEYEAKDYNNYTNSQWNCFFAKNAFHQIFSFCNEISVDYAYKKIKELSPEFNNKKYNSETKKDISYYVEVFEKFGLIKFIKIFTDDINKKNQK